MDSKEIARTMLDEQEAYRESQIEKPMAEPGSVSWGTMRPEDLIPKFLDKLEHLDKDRHDEIVGNYISIGWPGSHDRLDMSDYLLEELFDALNEHAPDGHYFGSHPGDGSDYGFWPFEDD